LTLEAEFESMFRAYQPAITGYLCNLVGDAERGQDLAQETFLQAYLALVRGTWVEHPRA